MFHTLAEHPAAEQQGIHNQIFLFDRKNRHANVPVVTKLSRARTYSGPVARFRAGPTIPAPFCEYPRY